MQELYEEGDWYNILMFADKDGEFDLKLVGLIYGSFIVITWMFVFFVREALSLGDDDKDKRD